MCGGNVSTMMNMMQTVLTIGRNDIVFHLLMMVEAYRHQHWQIHQYQQPSQTSMPSVNCTHSEINFVIRLLNIAAEYTNYLYKGILFILNIRYYYC